MGKPTGEESLAEAHESLARLRRHQTRATELIQEKGLSKGFDQARREMAAMRRELEVIMALYPAKE